MTHFEIPLPTLFNYKECLTYLERSSQEVLHRVADGHIFKLIEVNGNRLLVKIGFTDQQTLSVEILNKKNSLPYHSQVQKFIEDWFDLATPLEDFYESAKTDILLSRLTAEYAGLRIMKVPNLFEALSWAIIGQQINLTFAYQVKRNLVEFCDDALIHEGEKYFLFPKPEQVLTISDAQFREMKFSKQKVTYIREVAKAIISGEISRGKLFQMKPQDMKEALTNIKGIGNWSANYAMMRCLHVVDAFPLEDAGLHQALKRELNLDRKPTKQEITEVAKNWGSWKAYVTFYLWRSLKN